MFNFRSSLNKLSGQQLSTVRSTQMINEKKKDYLIPPSALVAVSFSGSISNILFQYCFDWL